MIVGDLSFKVVFFDACIVVATNLFQIIAHPPIPETLVSHPGLQTCQITPFPWQTAGAVNARDLLIHIDQNTPP